MFHALLANRHVASTLDSDGIPIATHLSFSSFGNIAQAEGGFDNVALIAHLTQNALQSTTVLFECALSTNGPWIEAYSWTSNVTSDKLHQLVPKAPLWRVRVTAIGAGLTLTAGVVA